MRYRSVVNMPGADAAPELKIGDVVVVAVPRSDACVFAVVTRDGEVPSSRAAWIIGDQLAAVVAARQQGVGAKIHMLKVERKRKA